MRVPRDQSSDNIALVLLVAGFILLLLMALITTLIQ